MSKLVALVTGGGSGIGKAIALRLAKTQPVLIIGRTEEHLVATQREIIAAGGECDFLVVDLAENPTPPSLLEKLTALEWEVSSLILNAGVWELGSSVGFSQAKFDEMLKVNFVANWALTQLLLPAMLGLPQATVVFNCGIVGIKAFGRDAAYVATKHALFGLAASLAAEHSRTNVRFVPFCTGFVEGERTGAVVRSIADRKKVSFDDAYLALVQQTPAGRIIPVADFSEAVARACDSASGAEFVSGVPVTLADKS